MRSSPRPTRSCWPTPSRWPTCWTRTCRSCRRTSRRRRVRTSGAPWGFAAAFHHLYVCAHPLLHLLSPSARSRPRHRYLHPGQAGRVRPGGRHLGGRGRAQLLREPGGPEGLRARHPLQGQREERPGQRPGRRQHRWRQRCVTKTLACVLLSHPPARRPSSSSSSPVAVGPLQTARRSRTPSPRSWSWSWRPWTSPTNPWSWKEVTRPRTRSWPRNCWTNKVSEPVRGPDSELVRELVSKPVSEPVSDLVSKPVSDLVCEPTSHPGGEPVIQPSSGPSGLLMRKRRPVVVWISS